jgi:hypothetical protein
VFATGKYLLTAAFVIESIRYNNHNCTLHYNDVVREKGMYRIDTELSSLQPIVITMYYSLLSVETIVVSAHHLTEWFCTKVSAEKPVV